MRSWGLVASVVGCVLVACSPDPCGNGSAIAAVGLDVSGHSNDDCTLSVTDGETTLLYDFAAPTPPLTDAPADALAPPAPCSVAGVSSRSATQICFAGDSALDDLAHARNVPGCPLRITFMCGGAMVYEVAPWNFCYQQC